VKKGNYSNATLLTIINKTRALNLTFKAIKVTEVAVSDYVSQNISLTGSYEQNVQLDLGGLFDIGFQ
jgi:hypothetical protein